MNDVTMATATVLIYCFLRIQNILPNKPDLGVGFFPALLEESLQHNLPAVLKPKYHYLSNEAVLDLNIFCDGIERHTPS